MARFPIVEEADAPPEVKVIYDEVKSEMEMTYVQNWFKVQAAHPILLRGNWEKVRATLLRGRLPMTTKQLILYAVSSRRGCAYCTEIHKGVLSELGVGDQVLRDVCGNLEQSSLPEAVKVAISVASKSAFDPQSISSDDIEKLFDAGYSEAEAQEVLSQADLVNMLNHIADVSGIELDRELAEDQLA